MVRLAIDLGSQITKIYKVGSGVVLAEHTCVAMETENGGMHFKAFGDRAYSLNGRAATNTRMLSPVKEGNLEHPELIAPLLSYFLEKIDIKPKDFRKCEALFVLPYGAGKDLRKKYGAMSDGLEIGRMSFTKLPYAAVIGHNVQLCESTPVFCVDIGHSLTNIAVLSLDGILSGFSINVGGGNITTHLMSYVAEEFGLRIGPRTAEDLKISVGNLLADDEKSTVINGRNVSDGSPASMSVSASQIQEIVRIYVDKITEYVMLVLNGLPAEATASVMRNGIYLSGGAAKCDGIDSYMSRKIGIPVTLSDEPQLSSIVGAGTILSSDRLYSMLTE